MAYYRITVKASHNINNIKLDKGMNVEVSVNSSNPLGFNNGDAVKEAFAQKYGFDLRNTGMVNSTHMNVEKLS